jgi:hypothetical protein
MAVHCAVQQALGSGHLPAPTNQIRLSTHHSAMLLAHTQQPTGGHRRVGTFDAEHLWLAESRSALDQARSRCTHHHPTRRSDRLHPLRHPHLLTDRGVTQSAGADLPAIT